MEHNRWRRELQLEIVHSRSRLFASSPRVARQMDPLDSKQSAEPRTAASPLESPHNPDDLAVPFPPSPIHDRRAGRIMKAFGSETDPNPRRKICLLLF